MVSFIVIQAPFSVILTLHILKAVRGQAKQQTENHTFFINRLTLESAKLLQH